MGGKNPLDIYQEENKVARAFNGLIKSVASKGLDKNDKATHLHALSAAKGDSVAVNDSCIMTRSWARLRRKSAKGSGTFI